MFLHIKFSGLGLINMRLYLDLPSGGGTVGMQNFMPPAWILNLNRFEENLYFDSYEKNSFESSVKSELVEKMGKIASSFRYWNNRLKEDCDELTLIFSIISEDGFKKILIKDLFTSIKSIIPLEQIKGTYYTESNVFFGISFQTQEIKDFIQEKFRTFKGDYVAFVNAKENLVKEFKIHWIPPKFPVDKIKKILGKYSDNVFLENEYTEIDNGIFVVSNVLRGRMTLKVNIEINELPHLIKINENRLALLIVKSRLPLCLKCKTLGHKRKTCKYKKCFKCQTMHLEENNCVIQSYATAAKRNSYNDHFENPGEQNTLNSDSEKHVQDSRNYENANKNKIKSTEKGTNIDLYCDKISEESQSKINKTIEKMDICGKNMGAIPKQKSDNLSSIKYTNKISPIEACVNSDYVLVTRKVTRSMKRKSTSHDLSPCKEICKDSLGTDSLFNGLLDEMDLKDGDNSKHKDTTIRKSESKECLSDDMNLKSEVTNETSTSDDLHMETNSKHSDGSDNELSEDSSKFGENDLCLEGFPKGTTVEEVQEFLGNFKPDKVWANLDQNNEPDGYFGATYSTKEKAMGALALHKKKYKGKRIYITSF